MQNLSALKEVFHCTTSRYSQNVHYHFLAFQDTITYKTKPDSLIEHQLEFFHKAKL